MSSMNIAKFFVQFFFNQFIKTWKKMIFIFWIKNDSFWMIEAKHLRILKAFKNVEKNEF